jgi:hypothetical protein
LGLLRDGVETATATDACWVLTGAEVFTRLTVDRGWDGDTYQGWLAGMLAATLREPESAAGSTTT